ncbi:MAG: adenine phosphoribosyltransferase [Calditrichaeota bacterium]|nr:MAG: adenine phosphoribosyltransferase [Calditrichota bacterium]
MQLEEIRSAIRDVPDFPQKGILFKDITTILNQPEYFKNVINLLYDKVCDNNVDYVAGIESRGFIFGSVLADRLNCGFVPIRKPGKLPAAVHQVEYQLEYGADKLEIHRDAFPEGKNVVIIDDLLATGGTAAAAAELVEKAGGKVIKLLFIIELAFLKGRQKISKYDFHSLIEF